MTNIKLPPEVLLLVFSKLNSPNDLSKCAQVCRDWRAPASEQGLWLRWCSLFWIPTPSTVERENTKERDKEKFQTWQNVPLDIQKNAKMYFVQWYRLFRGFTDIYGDLKTTIYRLSNWLRSFSPSTYLTLMPGKNGIEWRNSVQELSEFLEFDSMSIPDNLKPFLLFHHFYDGQKPRVPHVDAGLFGTYSCYNQYSSTFMLPQRHLKREVVWGISLIVFAVCPRTGKYLSIVLNAPMNPEIQYHVVEIDETRGQYISKGLFKDFLFKYVDDLEQGVYDVTEPDGAISIFPNQGEFTSTCETNGLQVIASSIAQLESGSPTGVWCYRIKIKYLGGLGVPRTCQLVSRKWRIKYLSGKEDEIEGEAVVGRYPEFSLDRPVFTYCSICTGQQFESEENSKFQLSDPAVWMEGEFKMVPGTIERPLGDRFVVKIGRLFLQQSKLINRSPDMQMDVLSWD